MMAIIQNPGARSLAVSDYVAPEEMRYAVFHFVLIAIFSGLAIIAVGLRLWARKIQKQVFWLSDYLVVLGLVSLLSSRNNELGHMY